MAEQVVQRKRAAPGASPGPRQALQASEPANPSQLTNDQFLRWGNQSLSAAQQRRIESEYPATISATMANNGRVETDSAAHHTQQSTQLMRRPNSQQLVHHVQTQDNGTATGDFSSDGSNGLQLQLHGDSALRHTDEDLVSLEQRALVAKREAIARRKQIQPFVQKLKSFLDQGDKNTRIIRWSDSGNSFIVLDEDEFTKTLIPEHFKHRNYASFVRQLNMYGFHKKIGLSDNSLKATERASEQGGKSPSEYTHPYFRRDHPNLLWLINKPKHTANNTLSRASKENGADGADGGGEESIAGNENNDLAAPGNGQARNAPRANPGDAEVAAPATLSGNDLETYRKQIQTLQENQKLILSAIKNIQRDQAQIYEQAMEQQKRHETNENRIQSILTFLAAVYSGTLKNQNGQAYASNLTGAGNHDGQGGQRDVVDIGDAGENPSRVFKRQLLLGGPSRIQQADPSDGMPTVSPSPASTVGYGVAAGRGIQSQPPSQATTPAAQGLAAAETTSPLTRGGSQEPPVRTPQQDMLHMIDSVNNDNQDFRGGRFEWPDMLTNPDNFNGNSQLTPSQRDSMLQLIGQGQQGAGVQDASSALVSPPNVPGGVNDLSRLEHNRNQLEYLTQLQATQEAKVQKLADMVKPLSPNGSIPGLNDASLNNVYNEPGAFNLDQIFNTGDYFGDAGDLGNFDLADGHELEDGQDFDFDFGMGEQGGLAPVTLEDGNNTFDDEITNQGGRVVSTVNSSTAASPEVDDAAADEPENPNKRQRFG
ncbi:MAG: hypothetical protein M1825_005564 [Sarcosagium campestre]|nr:MAG: hypothetical protein M1825_005564 [Sarcosagium campestre]